MITGQLMIRKTSKVINGREVMMVFGVMAAGEGEAIDLKDEHQYTLVGTDAVGRDCSLALLKDGPVDQTDFAYGCRVDQLLTSPIWRI